MKYCSILFFLFAFCITQSIQAQNKYPSTLWEITGPGLKKPSYLFGTYHISSRGVFKINDSLLAAIKSVDIVANEVNANTWQWDQARMDTMQAAYYKYSNDNRENALNENTFKKFNTVDKLSSLIGLVPSFANYFLYRNSGNDDSFEEEMYLDRFISSTGAKYGKEVRGLENYFESTTLVTEGQKDAADVEKKERRNIPGGISYQEMNDRIYDGYLNNNLNPMDSFMIYQYESEAFFNKFITKRNYNQADSLEAYMKTGKTVFGAVGCAHLPGEEGIIEIFRKRGYTMRPMKFAPLNMQALAEVKKMIVPVTNSMFKVDDGFTVMAPGQMYPYYATEILKTYGHVDMKNGAYYLIARLRNNGQYYKVDGKKLIDAVDSLLYSSVRGEIVSKKPTTHQGYPALDVETKVKNKDVERYRFIATPYEIVKMQVGGKNNYASSPLVDEFLNSITFSDIKEIHPSWSFSLNDKTRYHIWRTNLYGTENNKLRVSNYDAGNNQKNDLLKIKLPVGEKVTDSIVRHVFRESYLKSEMFEEDLIDDLQVLKIHSGETHKLRTKDGQQLLVKLVSQHPYLYCLTSLAAQKVDESFINSFKLKNYSLAKAYRFTDVEKGFSVDLPFEQKFDAEWKKQNERVAKKFDSDKEPNAQRNLYAYPTVYGNDDVSDSRSFVDDDHFEKITLREIVFDSLLTYVNASKFWENELKRYEDDDESGNRNSKLDGKILSVTYDTLSNMLQKVQMQFYDSSNGMVSTHQYYLVQGKLFHLSANQFGSEKTPFQKMVFGSFTPIASKQINLFQPKLLPIIKQFFTADRVKQPNVLSKLNNFYLGLRDLPTVDSFLNTLKPTLNTHNILKIKLVDLMSEGLYSDAEWPKISKWLQKIYSDKSNLATVRSFALSRILSQERSSDMDWISNELIKQDNPFKKRLLKRIRDYFAENGKGKAKKALPFKVSSQSDLMTMQVMDTSYITPAARKAAFDFLKKSLEDERLDLQIAQEESLFKFNEKELDQTVTTTQRFSKSNFESLIGHYGYFHNSFGKDPFFEDVYQKVLSANSDNDAIALARVLLKQPKPDLKKIEGLVKQLVKNGKNIYAVNKLYYETDKYGLLADSLKNRVALAQDLLLSKWEQYNKLSSTKFLKVEAFPYNKDSIYFFNYIKEKETNTNLAYVILDSDFKFLTELDNDKYRYTNEKISKVETYEKLSKKIMRKIYTETRYGRLRNFYSGGNDRKQLDSDD